MLINKTIQVLKTITTVAITVMTVLRSMWREEGHLTLASEKKGAGFRVTEQWVRASRMGGGGSRLFFAFELSKHVWWE